jgi:hypothetical protein
VSSEPIATDAQFERAMARIREAAGKARDANTNLEAATDDLTDEVYPGYDGDGEPV